MKVFHHNDIDGHAAAAIIQHLFPQDVCHMQLIECNYTSSHLASINAIAPGEQVYILDYSFSQATLPEIEAIINHAGITNVTWVDHHQSSLDLQQSFPQLQSVPGIRQLGISGAALTWMYFNDCPFTSLPLILQHVSDYDCWIKSMPGTDAVNYGILAQDWHAGAEIWHKAFSDNSTVQTLRTRGEAILDYVRATNQVTCEKWAFESNLLGYKCLSINRKQNSEIFGSDLSRYPLYCIFQFDGKIWRYTIYSQQIDCSALAAHFGGGGHKVAAGFTTAKCLFTAN